LPLGVNLAPKGEICALGEHSLLFIRIEGQTEKFTSRGITSPLGDKIHPWGTTSLGGGEFANVGEVRIGLWELGNLLYM
jgi:hypothetical protein